MHRHRVLIIEDDADTRSALGRTFSRMGWMVRLAATASEGMEWINSGHEPCCLILDLDLPDGRGEWALQLAREKGLRSYIVVCTGLNDPNRLAVVADLKPDVILTKPIASSQVWKGLCRIVGDEDTTAEMPTVR